MNDHINRPALVDESELTHIPGTNYWCLVRDTNLTPTAFAQGTIKLETSLFGLPDVKALRPGDVVLDVGAFIGDTALHFWEAGCVVYAFEPQCDAYECLRRNVPAAYCFNVAVGNGERVSLSQETWEDKGNLGTRGIVRSELGLPTFRIDDLELPRVDLMKIDVEGAEALVLQGATQTLKRCRPKLLMEVFDSMLRKRGTCREELLRLVESLGYRWQVALGEIVWDRCDIICYPGE